eukprot:scaffold11206_cov117-Isochrysis_galbana.AAC.20
MCEMSLSFTPASPFRRSKPPTSAVATSASACSGHGRNQSIVHPLMSPGKACARLRNLTPTGEKQSDKWRLVRTLVHGTHLAEDGIQLIAGEQVGQLASIKEDVDILKEALILDLLVREQKADRLALHARTPVERLEVLQQVSGIV